MVSSLSPQQFRQPEQVDLVGSYLGGQRMAQGNQIQQQNIRQNEQQISQADYEQATQRLSVINRLATKVKELPQSDRYAFVQSINPEMLQSVGIDPKTVSSVQLDDNSLDALIAQTAAALPQSSQYRKESVSTNQGLMVFDPSTGTYVPAKGSDGASLSAAQYDPSLQGQIATAKQTGQNVADIRDKPVIAGSIAQAQANVELATKPTIEAETTAARERSSNAVAKENEQSGNAARLPEFDAAYDKLIGSDLDKIYGRGESLYPDYLRSQEGIDQKTYRDQLVSMLKLGARGQLKGQGAVSDSETKTLNESVSVLGNPDISPQLAREALNRARDAIYASSGRSKGTQGGSGKGSSTPGKLTYDPATRTFK